MRVKCQNGLFAVCLCALSSPALALDYETDSGHKFNFWGFAQLTAEHREDRDNDDVTFDADRVRAGVKWSWNSVFAGLHVDLNNTGDAPNETLDRFIRDAFGGYKFSNAASIKVGQFKTPVGMSFNMSGKKLPLTKRPLTDRYGLDRTLGLMVSGRKIDSGFGSFGYDVGVFNPATRAAQVSDTALDQSGDANAYAIRAMYDYRKTLHLEASYGTSEEAGGAENSEDYNVYDIGAILSYGPMRFRAEFIEGENVRGVEDQDVQTYFLEGSYRINPKFELTARFEDSSADTPAGHSDLQNIYFGVTSFLLGSETNGRVQLNYVTTSGDEDSFPGFGGGFRGDAILAQFQVSF